MVLRMICLFLNLTLNIVSVNASDVAQSLQMVAWYLSYNT